jgi:hypothetical protein
MRSYFFSDCKAFITMRARPRLSPSNDKTMAHQGVQWNRWSSRHPPQAPTPARTPMARTDSPAPAKDRQTSSSFFSITSSYLLRQLSAGPGQVLVKSKVRKSFTVGPEAAIIGRFAAGRSGCLGLSSLSRAFHQLLTSGYAPCSAVQSRFTWAETAKTDINN